MKAIILSAGYGTRLRPITETYAKPLVKVLGIPVIEYTLWLLSNAGIDQVLINRHYFPDQFENLKIPHGMKLTYTVEQEILGTLGGILSFKDQIENDNDDDFLVINGDIIFDVSIEDIILKHKRKKNLATMVLASSSFNDKATPVYVDDFSNIISIGGSNIDDLYKKHMFAGIHVINKGFFKKVTPVKNLPSCIVRDFYIPYIKSGGHINAFLMGDKDLWLEIGNIKKYLDANLYILDQLYKYKINFNLEEVISEYLSSSQLVDGIWVSYGSLIDHDCIIIPPVLIGKNSKIEGGSSIGPNVIIGDDVLISGGTKLEDSLVLDKIKMTQSGKIKRAVVISNNYTWQETK